MKALGKLATLLVAMACALPAIAQSDETAKRVHVFPQLADGGGWQSVLLVTNVAQSSSFCTFELHVLSLDRFPDVSGITMSGSTATFSLDGPGGYLTWRTKNESALATGYATLDCTAPVVAQVLYASRDGSGVTGMATVFSSQAGGVFQFPVLTADASLGIAIANDTNTEASCRFVLESPEREELGEATLQVSSKSNVARFLHQIISVPGGFTEGSATVSCDQQVVVIGLQFAGAIFLTLPPAVLSTTPVSLTTPAGLAPADQAAFDTLVVGKQIVQDAYNYRLIFIAAGRIREIDGGTPFTGNYRYARTGPNTGMLTYTYDDTGNAPNVERSEVLFTFTSATAGTFVYTHIEGGMILGPLPGSFELVDAESEGESFGVGDVLPGVPTGAQLFPVSGWATEWSGVIFSGTADRSTTYLTFDDGGYITLQTGTRYTCQAAGGCRVGNGVIIRGTMVTSTAFPPPPDPPPPPMSSTCAAGLVIQPDGSCDVVVGGSTVGTFSVSSTSGCLRIGGGITFCSGNSHNIQGSRFNQYLITFVANRRQDGSWEITSYSIST